MPSHSASLWAFVRFSMLTPVSVNTCVVKLRRWMRNWLPALLHRIPHQAPSLNHSLFWGFDSVGVVLAPAPEKLGPSKPTSWASGTEARAPSRRGMRPLPES